MDGQGKRVFFFLFSEISHDLPGVATHCLPSCRTQKTIMEQCQDLPVKAERNKMLSEVNSTFSKKKKKNPGEHDGVLHGESQSARICCERGGKLG